jgi:hypothetical protein
MVSVVINREQGWHIARVLFFEHHKKGLLALA